MRFKAHDHDTVKWVDDQKAILNATGRYHALQLPDGTVLTGVQPVDHLQKRLARFPVPEDLTGKRVLDIGAWDGWFSFEMERRGAEVMAVDIVDVPAFREGHRLLNSKVDYRILDMDELTPDSIGQFDIVLFFGVLYHLRHPLLGLERVRQLTRDLAFVESFVTDEEFTPGQPTLEFYETDELGGQIDNWFGPSTSCLTAMCRAAGFARVELGEIEKQRAHVTCSRRWEAPPAQPAEAAPELGAAVNNRDWTNKFPRNKDLYACCFFSTPRNEIAPQDLRIELDGYGAPALSAAYSDKDGWQANFWLPSGLAVGPHEVRMRTADSGYSNTVPLEVV